MKTADQVWGAAVAADRINGGYYKEPLYDFNVDQRNPVKEANKVMVKNWLHLESTPMVTAADIELGQTVRSYFHRFLMKELSGKINDFERQALRLAQKDQFEDRDNLAFAIISSLPSVMKRDKTRVEMAAAVRESTQLQGAEGTKVTGEIVVIKTYFNSEFNKHKVTAKLGDSYVDFWHSSAPVKDTVLRIQGKIKRHRGDNTTQLNYVKIIG